MLSIFQKKYFLVDLLEGFTDFHNHLLPTVGQKKGKKMPLVIFVVVSFLMRFRVGGLGMFYLNDVTSQLWYVGDSRDS